MLDTKFWSDTYISTLEPLEKLLFLYLITNEKTDICGIYELPMKIMMIETDMDKKTIETILEKFGSDNKILYKNGWILLQNFVKHQNFESPTVDNGIRKSLSNLPLEIRKIAYGMGTVYKRYLYRSGNTKTYTYTNTNTNTNAKSGVRDSLSLEGFIEECMKDPKPEMKVIGEWADTIRPKFTKRKQWAMFAERNMAIAEKLVPFTHNQIAEAFERMQAAQARGKLERLTLEALFKFLTAP
jgi:hypothetical protein